MKRRTLAIGIAVLSNTRRSSTSALPDRAGAPSGLLRSSRGRPKIDA